MSDTKVTIPHLSRYWVFNEQQLEQALAEYLHAAPTPLLSDSAYETITGFLFSSACRTRGMLRGTDDETDSQRDA